MRQLVGPYGSQPTTTQPTGGSLITPDAYTKLRQTLGTIGLKQGGKPSEIETYLKWIEPATMTDQERAKSALEQKISLAEKLWFPNEKALALPKEGNWLQRQAHKLKTQYEASSAYTLFSRHVRTMGATLAKAAGDTGNIAWAEQAAQLQAMADANLTKEEAEQAFKNMRTSLGLQKRDEGYYNALRKGEDPAIISGINPDELSSGAIDAFVTPKFTKVNPQTGTVKPEKSLKDLNLAQRVLGTGEDILRPNLPLSGAGGEIGSVAGATLGGKFLPFPLNLPGLRTLTGGIAGQTYENIGKGGIPLTLEGRKEKLGYDIRNPSEIIPGEAKYAWENYLKPILPAAVIDALFAGGGKSLLGKLRNYTASRAMPISGEPIAQAGVDLAESGPATLQPSLQKLALQGIEKFSGKTFPVPEMLNQATASQNAGFTLTGGLKPTAAGLLERAYAETMRRLIAQSSPMTGYLTTGLYGASQAGNAVKFALNKLLLPLSIIYGSQRLNQNQ